MKYIYIAHELEVIGLVNKNKVEQLKLFTTLKLRNDQHAASKWFDSLVKLMKSSLFRQTQSYLDCLDKYINNNNNNGDLFSSMPLLSKRLSDVKESPIQSIILGESLIWCKFMSQIIETNKLDDLKQVMKLLFFFFFFFLRFFVR